MIFQGCMYKIVDKSIIHRSVVPFGHMLERTFYHYNWPIKDHENLQTVLVLSIRQRAKVTFSISFNEINSNEF